MNICVTSPRKRMGQTITAINLSAMITKLINQRAILIDLNQYCRDIEYYLSDTHITKGLDDFYSLYSSNLLNKQSFPSCIKRVRENIDIMASNGCFDIGNTEVEVLLDYVDGIYPVAVVDTAAKDHVIPPVLFDKSSVILVVINQMKNIVQQLQVYRGKAYTDKIVFIVNRYMEKSDGIRVKYQMEDIEADLRDAGFGRNRVFPLDHDPEIINECNDHSILNCILNKSAAGRNYTVQMGAVARHVLRLGGVCDLPEPEILTKKPALKVYQFFNL